MGMVKKAICDCCGKEFKGTYYYLLVYAKSTEGGLTFEAAAQNLQTNLSKDKIYCPECMAKIRDQFHF